MHCIALCENNNLILSISFINSKIKFTINATEAAFNICGNCK